MRGSPSKIDTMSAHGPKRTRRSVTVAAVFGLKRDVEFNRCPVAMQFSIIFCLYNTHILSISNSYGPICTLAAAAGRALRAPKIRDAVHENQNQSDSSPTPCLSRIAVFASDSRPASWFCLRHSHQLSSCYRQKRRADAALHPLHREFISEVYGVGRPHKGTLERAEYL
jgi:hypothetical protein